MVRSTADGVVGRACRSVLHPWVEAGSAGTATTDPGPVGTVWPVSIARRLRPPTGDAVLAVAVAALLVVGALATQQGDPGEYDLSWWGAMVLTASGLALAWRRTWPLTVALVVGVLDVSYGVSNQPDPPLQIATLVALYTVASRCSRRTTVIIVVILPVGVMVAALLAGDSDFQDYYRAALPALGALLVGDQVRERSAAAAAERQHAAADAVVLRAATDRRESCTTWSPTT